MTSFWILWDDSSARVDLDGKDVEQGEHFPTQENHGDYGYGDRQDFTKTETAAARLKAPGDEAENVQGRKAEHQHPEDVIDVVLLGRGLECDEQHGLQADKGGRRPGA